MKYIYWSSPSELDIGSWCQPPTPPPPTTHKLRAHGVLTSELDIGSRCQPSTPPATTHPQTSVRVESSCACQAGSLKQPILLLIFLLFLIALYPHKIRIIYIDRISTLREGFKNKIKKWLDLSNAHLTPARQAERWIQKIQKLHNFFYVFIASWKFHWNWAKLALFSFITTHPSSPPGK